jgi:hypothetical protein
LEVFLHFTINHIIDIHRINTGKIAQSEIFRKLLPFAFGQLIAGLQSLTYDLPLVVPHVGQYGASIDRAVDYKTLIITQKIAHNFK